jgi:DNA-binding PadR family transcriptional regulator
MTAPRPRSPLWLVVLAMAAEAPMHPYRMQTLIKERGKDLVANVAQRNSVYQTIDALRRGGLVEVRETTRDEHRPERTIYQATPLGRTTLKEWMQALLAAPAREFPDFPAALSLVMILSPDEARTALETRVIAVDRRLRELEAPVPGVPRLFLLESEYMAALVRAERDWLRRVIDDLRRGRLTWSLEWLQQQAIALAGEGSSGPAQVKTPATQARSSRRPWARRTRA